MHCNSACGQYIDDVQDNSINSSTKNLISFVTANKAQLIMAVYNIYIALIHTSYLQVIRFGDQHHPNFQPTADQLG